MAQQQDATAEAPESGAGVSRRRRMRLLLVPVLVVVAWLVVSGVAGPASSKLADVQTNDNASFLPPSAESTRALDLETQFAGEETVPLIVVWERDSGITTEDRAAVAAAAQRMAGVEGITGRPTPPLASQDGKALQVVISLPAEGAFENAAPVVEKVRDLAKEVPAGLDAYGTGPGGYFADFSKAFDGIDGRLLGVTALVVLVIVLAIYRSPVFLPVLVSAGLALTLAQAVTYVLAKNDVLTVNGQSAGILLVLVFGAGTDYALLLISRFKEELHRHERSYDAMRTALRATFEPILASGTTVAIALLCLLLSNLNSNKSLGPVAAVGIVCAMLTGLTFLPAVLVLLGRYWFWPVVPRNGTPVAGDRGAWGRVASLVGRRSAVVAAVTGLGLLGLAVFTTALEADGLPQNAQFTTASEAVDGQTVLERHFPAGTGSPVSVIGAAEDADRLRSVVAETPGIAEATVLAAAPGGAPKQVDGKVLVQGLLEAAPDSIAAEDVVVDLRKRVDAVSPDVLVGGNTALTYDVNQESARDVRVIIPVILLVILVILGLLLRSLVAPVVLVATVVLSFLATLGVCALVFRYVFGFEGEDPSFPLFAFVFLVALGIDYNIFLMTRVREEALRHGTRYGTRYGLAVTGAVITSAGVVLAATFSALGVLPLVFLAQLGFAVAFGVLLDTLVVRSLLVPALVNMLGDRTWWPFTRRFPRDDGDAGVPRPSAHHDVVTTG